MNRRSVLVAISLLALPLAANAQTASGPYVSVAGGVNMMQEEDVDARLSSTTDVPGEVLTSAGPAFVGAFGWGLGKGLRVEAEYSFRSNGISSETGLSGEDFGTGTEKKSGMMGNFLYDLKGSRIKPYVGLGIGAQFVHEPDATSSVGGVTVNVAGGTKTSFAYQLIGGAAFPVQHGLSITAEYRFLSLTGTRTYDGTVSVPGLGTFPLTDTSSSDKNHSILFGIRYTFGG